MEVIGKIIYALPEVTGVSKTSGNPWKKREYVLETKENFPRKIHFDFFGERADQYPLTVGQEIKLYFDIDSHEYQGKWFTSIRGWKAEPADGATMSPAPQAPQQFAPAAPYAPSAPAAPQNFPTPGAVPPPPEIAPGGDDLPF